MGNKRKVATDTEKPLDAEDQAKPRRSLRQKRPRGVSLVVSGDYLSHDGTAMELKKAAPAIHIATTKGKISFLQKKMINIFLYNAYPRLLEQETHSIRIKTLAELVGFDSNDYETLKSSIRQIRDIGVEWNVLSKDGKAKWGVSSMISEAEIEDGVIHYSYAPKLRSLLYNPDIFAKIDLRMQRKFSSGYALSLYENCYRFKAVGSTGEIPVDICKQLLGVEPENENYYKEFKNFNRKVLKPAQLEVNDVSDINVEIQQISQGRKVVALKFLISEKNQHSFDFASTHPYNKDLYQRMLDIGLTEQQAKDCLVKYSEEYISGNLAVVEVKLKSNRGKPIENAVGYFLDALKADYRPKETAEDKQKKKRAEQNRQAVEEAMAAPPSGLGDIKKAEQYLSALLEEQVTALQEEYSKQLTPRNAVYKFWKQKGFGHPAVMADFKRFVASQMSD